MNKNELAGVIAEKTGLNTKDAREIVNVTLDFIKDGLTRGERLEIRGLGSFEVRRRKKGVGRNISTGEKVPIPARQVPVFIPGKILKKLVNS
ncbi:MAG: HU family DNA-binding protein [bacterium]|nr:HU family DNA-binding protein [bacterium]